MSATKMMRTLPLALLLALVAGSVRAQEAQSGDVQAGDLSTVTASATVLGDPYSTDGTSPYLFSTAPVLGSRVDMAMFGAAGKSSGVLVVCPSAPTSVTLSEGLVIHVDLDLVDSWIQLPITMDAYGSLVVAVDLPNDPALAGTQLTMQSVILSGDNLAASNGLHWILGY